MKLFTSGYNGWSNYETWCVSLWMSNVESDYQKYLALASAVLRDSERQPRTGMDIRQAYSAAALDLSRALKLSHEATAPEVTGVHADLLGRALGSVDWLQIAEHWIDDAIDVAEVEGSYSIDVAEVEA